MRISDWSSDVCSSDLTCWWSASVNVTAKRSRYVPALERILAAWQLRNVPNCCRLARNTSLSGKITTLAARINTPQVIASNREPTAFGSGPAAQKLESVYGWRIGESVTKSRTVKIEKSK